MAKTHTHPCEVCGDQVDCHGIWEQNHDGFPAVTCTARHRPGGQVIESRCEECEKVTLCEGCGESPAVKVIEDKDDASGYRGELALCAICLGPNA
jgi:hypothetical protein